MTDTTRAYLFALLTVFFWSTVATAFKIALRYLDIYQLILYAATTATLILLAAVSIRGEARLLVSTFKRHWRITVLCGALNPFLYYLILFAAYDRLPAQVAQPINYTWAIVLTFLSIIVLRQRITVSDLVAAFVCYSGVVVIAIQGHWRTIEIPDGFGLFLALLSTVIWASYWLINIRDERSPTLALCLNFLAALPLALAACVLMSSIVPPSVPGLGAAVYVGFFEMGFSFLLWSHALRLAENTSRVSNLIFLSPFLSLVFIHYIVGEPIYGTTYAGLLIIVGGLAIQRLNRT